MIRKNNTKVGHQPLYRVIIPEALRDAWSRRYLWPFALFAGLLHTGGVYDVLLTTFREAGHSSLTITTGGIPPALTVLWSEIAQAQSSSFVAVLGLIQSVLIALLIVAFLVGLSVIAQGALVFGLGGMIRGRAPMFRECIEVGAHYAWRVLALNIITLFLGWLAKFVFLVPYGLQQTTNVSGLGVMTAIGAIVYALAVVALAAIHLFGLNAIVLQDAHVNQALMRAWHLIRHGWLTAFEIGTILFLFGAAILFVGILAFVLMALPLFLLMAVAALVNSSSLVYLGFILFVILFFGITLSAGMLAITFQYAAWHRLFLKLGEGGVLPKLHRWWLALSRRST